ncbi:MAG TPA: TonB-dependent receptor [Steroidobacteraceae bacterium]|nr:TonB-dependent receptor [Steroidobacteraceae bacterium]
MSNLHRKHPVSIAVSMALLSAMAASAMASPHAGAAADNSEAPASTPQEVPATPAAPAKKPGPKANGTAGTEPSETAELSTVTVVGVRASQIRAIELKRLAPDIQDSISAESIGQLPDTTITDALQRITGVQIDRNAGEGSQVDVRGLPEVGTMLNGEVFITPDQITSQQPDFETLPATLFNQVDVIKSPTAGQTESGISGSLDLHTFRPWDLPRGFTYSYSADAERGDTTRKTGPEASGLISYNGNGRWGLLFSGDYSDTTRNGPENGGPNAGSSEGLDQYGVVLNAESAPLNSAGGNYGGYTGFVAPWNGLPIPSKIVQNPDGSVDVNGDGKSNGVFMGSQNIGIYDSSIERKREAGNASFQMDLGDGFTLTSDYFYAHQRQWNRNVGLQFNSTDWQGATYVPLQSQNTGASSLGQYNTPDPTTGGPNPGWAGSQIYTTQVYEKWPGDVESYSQIENSGSTAQNANLEVDFNDGGDFKGSLRGVREKASQSFVETDLNISDSDGCLWPNQLMSGVDPNSVPCGTFIFPAQLGGNRVFNPIGIPEDSLPITANFNGRYISISMPAAMAANFANPNGWTMKTIESSGNYDADAAITALRFDGHYDLHHGLHLDFGVRNSIHTAGNFGYTFVVPVYGGIGASDPNGCLVRYVGADVIMAGDGNGGGCTAGNAQGYFRAGPISALQMPKTPPPLANNWQEYNNLLGSGINFWAVNPYAMDDPLAYWKSLYPNTETQEDPGNTWAVWMKESSAYLQTDFGEQLGDMPLSGNVGVRVIHTNLEVTQHLSGLPGLYGTMPADIGNEVTRRGYYDVLPDFNLALDLTPKLTLRLAASKNMQPLDLQTWGGGLELNYSLVYIKNPNNPSGPPIQLYQVAAGNSNGNPSLDPWRSTNYGASLEYYINPVSMVGLELFRINVQSFIENGNVQNCSLPDEDGVVRHHCITITEPVQGTGNSIQGAEFDYRQGFTFLPGLLADTGMEFNATYAPSKTGQTDLAGRAIPFQDNSTESGNFILWFQGKRFQVRAAYNYRSKRAVENQVGSIAGLEMYEAPQSYVDASLEYKFDKYVTLFVNGTNLTNEYQRYYLVWPSQEGHANFSERSYTVGIRGQW